MKGKTLSLTVIFLCFFCVQIFAGGKKDSPVKNEQFKQLQKYIADSENELKNIYDWDDKIYLYSHVILSIRSLIEESTDQSIIDNLQEILSDWEDRLWDFSYTIEELSNDLESAMQRRAIELAKARVRNSDFESISLISSDDDSYGGFIYLTNTYKIMMRGNILGIIGTPVDVSVKGQINMRNNTMQVLEANIR
jgi:hypothetical protein